LQPGQQKYMLKQQNYWNKTFCLPQLWLLAYTHLLVTLKKQLNMSIQAIYVMTNDGN